MDLHTVLAEIADYAFTRREGDIDRPHRPDQTYAKSLAAHTARTPAECVKSLWPGVKEMFPVTVEEADPVLVEELKRRLLYTQAVTAARCFEEGVITDPREADVGSILGWGFAPWSGGVISLIDAIGAAKFVEELERMTAKYGDRFAPPQLLRDMAKTGETFYGRFGKKEAKAA